MFASIPRTRTASQYVCRSCMLAPKWKRLNNQSTCYSNAAAAEESTGNDSELAGFKFGTDGTSRRTRKGTSTVKVSDSQESSKLGISLQSPGTTPLSKSPNTLAALRSSLRTENDVSQLPPLSSSKDLAVLERPGVKRKRRSRKHKFREATCEKPVTKYLVRRTLCSRHTPTAETAVEVASTTMPTESTVKVANVNDETRKTASKADEDKSTGKSFVKTSSKNPIKLVIDEKLVNAGKGEASLTGRIVKGMDEKAVEDFTGQAVDASKKKGMEGSKNPKLTIKKDSKEVLTSQMDSRRPDKNKMDGKAASRRRWRSRRKGSAAASFRIIRQSSGSRTAAVTNGNFTGTVPLKVGLSTTPLTVSTENTLRAVTDKLVSQLEGVALEACRRTVHRVLIDLMKRNATTYKTKSLIKDLLQESLTDAGSHSISKVVDQINSETLSAKSSPQQPNEQISTNLFKGKGTVEMQSVAAADLHLNPVEIAQPEVPRLAYGLERVLFNPGVYQLRDPRSRVFNFDPYLQSIMPVKEFDFNALKEYITSSRDQSLISTAIAEDKKYTGSTSSMTSALGHFHYLLSQWRPLKFSSLSQGFPIDFRNFTSLQRAPTAIFLLWKNGTYAIDADKEFDSSNILMMLGKSMEKLLTLPTKEYERYRFENSAQISQEERNQPESYHYTTMGDFLMRSQLDAYDPRLPGTGVFDIKTRAVVSIRMDAENYENGLGYEIKERHGKWESYEREYYDMIRAAFLKYSLQVRMGRMDGIFVAFHNTEKIFGFQYISIAEMDNALHGTDDVTTGDSEFKLSIDLLNKILNRATAKFPEQSLRLHFETRPSNVTPFMYIIAEPVNDKQVMEIQQAKRDQVEAFEADMLNLHRRPRPEEQKELSKEGWDELQVRSEEAIEREEFGSDAVESTDICNRSQVPAGEDEDVVQGPVFEETARVVGEFLLAANSSAYDNDELEDEVEGEDESGFTESSAKRACGEGNQAENDVDEIAIADGTANKHDKMLGDEVGGEKLDKMLHGAREFPQPSSHCLNLGINHSGAGTTKDDVGDQSSQAQDDDLFEEEEMVRGERLHEGETSHLEELTPLLAMTLTIRNKVNGKHVLRPENLGPQDKWTVEYHMKEEKSPERARRLYGLIRKRRAVALQGNDKFWRRDANIMAQEISHFAQAGRRRAREQEEADKRESIKRLDDTDREN